MAKKKIEAAVEEIKAEVTEEVGTMSFKRWEVIAAAVVITTLLLVVIL